MAELRLLKYKPTNLGSNEFQTIQQDPNNTQFWLTSFYIQNGNVDNKTTNFNIVAIEKNQMNPETYTYLGDLYKEKGHLDEALEYYQNAIALKPDHIEAYISMGSILLSNEKVTEAIHVYETALKYNPSYYYIWSDLGNLYKSLNKLEDAQSCYAKAIALCNTFAPAWSNLGCVFHSRGDIWLAIHHFERAGAIDGTFLDAFVNLGNVFKEARIFDRAATAYLKALNIDPTNSFLLGCLSCVYYEQGLYDLAIETSKRAIECQPDFPDAYCNLGNSLKEKGQIEEAEEAYQRALQLKPDHVDSLNNLANIKREQGLIEEASCLYEKALLILPFFSAAHSNLASILQYKGLLKQALHHYKQAIIHSPNFVNAYSNMGNALKEYGDIQGALDCYLKAIEINPMFVDAHCNLASLYKDSGNIKDAITHYKRALSIKPDFPDAFCNLVHCNLIICNWKDYPVMMENIVTTVQQQIEKNKLPSVHPHHSMLYPLTHETRRIIAARYANICIEKNSRHEPPCYTYPKLKGARLKVGYVSSDFGNHPTSHLMQSIPGSHSKQNVEIFCYALNPNDNTSFRVKLEAEAEHFIDLSEIQCNREAADKINADGIHILINMNGYTKGARNEIFAYRPSPIQVMWLGYPGTSGAPFMDYIITDKITSPPELAHQYSEKLAYMPNSLYIGDHKHMFPHLIKRASLSFKNRKEQVQASDNDYIINGIDLCFVDEKSSMKSVIKSSPNSSSLILKTQNLKIHDDPISVLELPSSSNVQSMIESNQTEIMVKGVPIVNGTAIPQIDAKVSLGEKVPKGLILTCRKQYNLPEKAFVYCNFNQLYKLDPDTLESWLKILKRVPQSVLWLLRFPPEGEQNILEFAATLGVEPRRIVFTNVGSKEEHVRRGQLADLCLDTPLCNGHTTGLDVLWAGTPMLTLTKEALPSRVAASQLTSLGLPELITDSRQDYENIAARLGNDREYLKTIRNKVWQARLNCPLFDSRLYASNLEKLYRNMWENFDRRGEYDHIMDL